MIFKPLTETEEWEWVQARAHAIACEDSQGVVVYDNDIIQAIAVFDSFTVDACSVHFAIDNPFVIKHGFLNEIARHLFIQCGRKRIPDAVKEGVDYIVMRMDKESCRWIEQNKEAA